MKKIVIFITACLGAAGIPIALHAQAVYTITADSTRITGCDSNELIIENHTQGVPGFLYNAGRGRTIFKRALNRINDTLYSIGADTLNLNYWRQGGNIYGRTGVLGTKDSNHIDFYTNNAFRGRWAAGGNLLLGTTTDNGYGLQVNSTGYFGQQLQVGNFLRGNPVSVSGASIITQGSVRAAGGFNLRDPINLDNILNGLFAGGIGVSLYSNNVPIISVAAIQGATGGTQIAIHGGYNPTTGSGTVNVMDFAYSGISMITGSNTITYNFLNLSPGVNQQTYGTGITRGLYINPSLSSAADWRSIETVRGDNRLNTTSGKTAIGVNGAPTSKLDIAGDNGYSQLRLRTSYTPTSTTDTNGNTGDFSWDGNYFYVKTLAGWKRSALSTF